MGDLGTGFTDDALKKVEGQIGRIYRQASKDVDAKLRDFTRRHKAREAVMRANVAAGKMTQDDFDAWMRGQVFQGQMWEARKAAIDAVLLHADEAAANVINTGRIGVFAENANYIGYNLEHGLRATSSFTLYNDTSVVRLFREHPDMLPRPKVEKAKAYGYYNRTINNCITQGIIQGESINKIARRISDRSGETNYKSAVRNARTAMTGAQNAGRLEGMRQAEKLGIDVQKQWVATLDDRTRDVHAGLDGQIRDKDQPFDSALGPIMYPGDSSADPANVWNCRCSIIDYYPKYPSYGAERLDNETGEILPDMTYKEWKTLKTGDTGDTAEHTAAETIVAPEKVDDSKPHEVERIEVYPEDDKDREMRELLRERDEILPERIRALNGEINEYDYKYTDAEIEKMTKERDELRERLTNIREQIANGLLDEKYGIESLASLMQDANIEFVPVVRLDKAYPVDAIIANISGGDMTSGSCASLAYCYVGQRAGFDVHDFRGGQSCYYIATNSDNIRQYMVNDGVATIIGHGNSSAEAALDCLYKMEPGKEYVLGAGAHCTIVRCGPSGRINDFQYLELQSGEGISESADTFRGNGWHSFGTDAISRLNWRFGTTEAQQEQDCILLDVDELGANPRFQKILGFINTQEDEQLKGAEGHER